MVSDPIKDIDFVLFVDDPAFDEPQYKPKNDRDGAEGMIKWCEDNVHIPIYPEGQVAAQWYPIGDLPNEVNPRTGKTYFDFWKKQKRILRQALRMKEGRLLYNLIVLCWMRGEGKSLDACLIQLWKFFNWTKQAIMLGANSRDQVKFVHYDIMRDIIQNSPRLFAQVGARNIQEKEIRIKDEDTGGVVSLIRSISSFSGIVSNITGFTFSEMFDMKNPRFFVQLYGSIRNVPNALGVIDSTVSEKTHILYKLYQNYINKKSKMVFFSYRYSRLAVPEDYWNPNMDEDQLNDYKEGFPFGDFERYFQNLWSSGALHVFSQDQIDEMGYIGVDSSIMDHDKIKKVITERNRYVVQREDMENKGVYGASPELDKKVDGINSRLKMVDTIYKQSELYMLPMLPSVITLKNLGDILDTDWALIAGADMGDPIATDRFGTRSIFTLIAKGLMGSRSGGWGSEGPAPRYIYFLIYLYNIDDHSLSGLKSVLDACHSEYDGVDTFCMERYGIGDLVEWCEERNIVCEPIYPNYERQKSAFKPLYISVSQGGFKAPIIYTPGSKKDDILREEFGMFDHSSEEKWFGSPEKSEKYGVQDDCMYSIAWAVYGGRLLTPVNFRPREGAVNFGVFIPEKSNIAKY